MIWGMTNSEKYTTIYSVGQRFAWYPVRLTDGQWVWWEYVRVHSWHSHITNGHRYERVKR